MTAQKHGETTMVEEAGRRSSTADGALSEMLDECRAELATARSAFRQHVGLAFDPGGIVWIITTPFGGAQTSREMAR